MAGHGGARAGAGAKKGSHRVHVKELRDAIEKAIGMPYQDILAATNKKLFNDFQNDINVKEYITFTENMSKRILEQPVQEVQVENISNESTPDLEAYRNNLLTRLALSSPAPIAAPTTNLPKVD